MPIKNEPLVTPGPVDMREHVKEQCDLAHSYACDGAYVSAARVLRNIAREVESHAIRVDAQRKAALARSPGCS